MANAQSDNTDIAGILDDYDSVKEAYTAIAAAFKNPNKIGKDALDKWLTHYHSIKQDSNPYQFSASHTKLVSVIVGDTFCESLQLCKANDSFWSRLGKWIADTVGDDCSDHLPRLPKEVDSEDLDEDLGISITVNGATWNKTVADCHSTASKQLNRYRGAWELHPVRFLVMKDSTKSQQAEYKKCSAELKQKMDASLDNHYAEHFYRKLACKPTDIPACARIATYTDQPRTEKQSGKTKTKQEVTREHLGKSLARLDRFPEPEGDGQLQIPALSFVVRAFVNEMGIQRFVLGMCKQTAELLEGDHFKGIEPPGTAEDRSNMIKDLNGYYEWMTWVKDKSVKQDLTSLEGGDIFGEMAGVKSEDEDGPDEMAGVKVEEDDREDLLEDVPALPVVQQEPVLPDSSAPASTEDDPMDEEIRESWRQAKSLINWGSDQDGSDQEF